MSERKYRQRGYRDEDTKTRSESAPPPEREGPRGRGLGKPTRTVLRCHACGTVIDRARIAPGERCDGCRAALHSCVHCRHFDPSARFECRQPIERAVKSKSGDNDCDRFEAKEASEIGSGRTEKRDDARSAFDDLFDF